MKAKLVEHMLSVVFVTVAFLVFAMVMQSRQASQEAARSKAIAPYVHLNFLDYGDPLDRSLLRESFNVFHPGRAGEADSILRAIDRLRQEQFVGQEYKTGQEERGISSAKLLKLGGMYIQFILLYLIVVILSYHAAQSLAIYRFVKMKQHRSSAIVEIYRCFTGPERGRRGVSFWLRVAWLTGEAVLKGISYAVLFAPAYVIGYSVRSTFDADSYAFMIVLGVISNGILINSANKFFTLLVTESRKGYVQAAIVKNLSSSYAWGTRDGLSYRALLRPRRMFPSHVFSHIFVNARYQNLLSLKEQASFLITGLIIIEMALNIQGHLGYELLQSILYRQYDVAMCIIVGIFLIIKGTEVVVDIWFNIESKKYENRV